MHNTGFYLALLIFLCLCLCSNYTPSGISPGEIPSHPSHSSVLIAADLQVRTHAKNPVKDSEGAGELAGCTVDRVEVQKGCRWREFIVPKCTEAAPETGQLKD